MGMLGEGFSSPSFFVQQSISYGGFREFTAEVYNSYEEKKLWQFYLAKYNEGKSFYEFKEELENKSKEMSDEEMQQIVNRSKGILNNFVPQEVE